MKRLRSNSIILILSVFSISFFFSCLPHIFNDDDYGKVSGVITDLKNSPLSGVKVQTDDLVVYSDDKGIFELDKVKVGKNIVLDFSKNNYSSTQKVVKVELNKTTFSYAALGKWDKSETIDPTKENTISFQNANVKLPANGIVDDKGNTFTGSVLVKAAYFDPTSDSYDKVFPGDFKGEDASGQEVAIESYGFINIELKDGDKNLNLAVGKTADISIPVPDAYKANAPDPIPLWYFEKETGIWKEDGTASILNGHYVGKVSHFSSWNCDIGFPVSQLKGKVVCKDGTPIKNALVKAKGFDSSWSNHERTKEDGSYIIDVKADAVANVYAWSVTNIGTLDKKSQTIHTNTPGTGDIKKIDDLIIDCDTATADTSYSTLYDINLDLVFVPIAVGATGKIIYYDLNSDIWKPVPAGTTQDLYSIAIPAVNNIWIVGSKGTVKHITDKIDQVNTVPIGTDAHLYNVEFYNGYYGWIMGTTGKLFKTVDGGDNWSVQVSGTTQTLYDAYFYSKDEGWICGSKGTILHTTDGGNNWNVQNSTTVEDLKGICFVDKLKGWAVGDNGKIVRTIDGGQTWSNQNVAGMLEDLNDIDFAHPQGGIIVGKNGTVLKTVDGGETWTNESVALKNNLEAVDIDMFGEGTVVGDDNLFKVNVGQFPVSAGWVVQNSNIIDTLRYVKAISVNEAWAVGDAGKVLHTIDAGNNWTLVSTGENVDFYSIDVSGNNIWIGGRDNTLIRSADYGANWQKIQNLPGGKIISKIQFIDANTGWLLLKNRGFNNKNEVLKTIDGGMNWSHYNSLPGGMENYYSDFHFNGINNGYVLDFDDSNQEMVLYATKDAGNSWTTYDFEYLNNEIGAIAQLNNTLMWVGGDFYLYHYESGKNWYGTVSTPLTIYENKQIEFLTPQIGYACSGGIRKTTNGGKTWIQQGATSGYIGYVNSLDMINTTTGWAVGADGKIYYTTTGGN